MTKEATRSTAAPAPTAPLEIPLFLVRTEPLAQFALWSDGRLHVAKADKSLSLSPDDIRELRRYFGLFGREEGSRPK